MPSAAGLSTFVRITAGAIGSSLLTTLWENRAILHYARLTESINATNPAATQIMGELAATGLSNEQVAANINRMIDQQAYTLAVTGVFCMSSLLLFALIAVVWFAKPQPGGAAGAGGAH